MKVATVLIFAFLFKDINAGEDIEELTVEAEENPVLSCPTGSDQFVQWYREVDHQYVELSFSERYHFPSINELKILNFRAADVGRYKCKSVPEMNLIKTFIINITVVHGQWGEWSAFGPCHVVACGAKRRRIRLCNGDVDCLLPGVDGERSKEETEFQICDTTECPVNGGFAAWSSWGDCSVECGSGSKTRNRLCTNPKPGNGGRDCFGSRMQHIRCRERVCERPKFVKFGFDVTGPNLILTCEVKGTPTPSVRWGLNSGTVPLVYNPGSQKLVIPKSRARTGTYSCTAQNRLGYFTKFIKIDSHVL